MTDAQLRALNRIYAENREIVSMRFTKKHGLTVEYVDMGGNHFHRHFNAMGHFTELAV